MLGRWVGERYTILSHRYKYHERVCCRLPFHKTIRSTGHVEGSSHRSFPLNSTSTVEYERFRKHHYSELTSTFKLNTSSRPPEYVMAEQRVRSQRKQQLSFLGLEYPVWVFRADDPRWPRRLASLLSESHPAKMTG
jgi:hypothetical protein